MIGGVVEARVKLGSLGRRTKIAKNVIAMLENTYRKASQIWLSNWHDVLTRLLDRGFFRCDDRARDPALLAVSSVR
jgi:hypothetical protein